MPTKFFDPNVEQDVSEFFIRGTRICVEWIQDMDGRKEEPTVYLRYYSRQVFNNSVGGNGGGIIASPRVFSQYVESASRHFVTATRRYIE